MSAAAITTLAGLLPDSAFVGRPEWALWGMSVAAIAMLALGADRAVSAAARLARAMRMSTVLIGATVVSLGTTTPEAVVSVRAAIGGSSGLSLGNGIGSIICNTALIFGLCCMLRRLPLDRFILNRHGRLQLASGALLAGAAVVLWAMAGWDIENVWITRPVGVAFLALLAGYMALSVHWARQRPEIVPLEAGVEMPRNHMLKRALRCLAVLAFGLALVVVGSDVLVGAAQEICRRRGVPEAVLAVAFVAFGTSVPELVTAVASIIKGHPELLLGNVIGANILNVLFVIGASAAAVPLQVEPKFFYLILPVMMLVLILMRLFIFISRDTFRRWQGAVLLGIYIAFLAVLVGRFGHEALGAK